MLLFLHALLVSNTGLALQSLMMFEHRISSLGPHSQMTFEQNGSSLVLQSLMTSSLGPHCQMASEDNTSGPAPHRKEKCTLQCVLSSKEEKSSYLRAILSTTSISSYARSVNKWINKDYEILFQTLFDEYFNPPPCAVSPDPVAVAAPRAVDPAGTPSSTTIDQDVPSASTLPTNQEIQSQVIHQGVEEQIHGNQNAQFYNAPLLHNLSLDLSSKETTLQGVISSNLHDLNQSFDTLTKLTKNHPLESVIGDPSRPVSTRSQLQEHTIVATLMQMTIRFHSVGNGLVEIYYLKGRIMVARKGKQARLCKLIGHMLTISPEARLPADSELPCSKTYFEANNLPKCMVFEFLRLPSCCVIFDLEPLSLSFDFFFDFEISKSFPCLS
ncbi:hypothetical protein Tco_0494376 [Tanacetum coccineum]